MSRSPAGANAGLSPPTADLKDKVIVLTGATSGIGRVGAEQLAARGARLVIVARDRERSDATLTRLTELNPGFEHRAHIADLSRIADMKRVAVEIAAAERRVDVLINNAGALFASRQVTTDGLEKTFALNHLSYFVLTLGLRTCLGPGSRVVNTASRAHREGTLHLDDLQSARRYAGYRVYGTTKLCNILFTRELARRWAGTGITANALHPGFVATHFGDESGGLMSWAVRAAKLFALTPEQGAETLVYLATSPEVANVSGRYYARCRPDTLTGAAQDDTAAKALWEASERLVDLRG